MDGSDMRLHLEILALLLQLAWADHTVEVAESDHILERAQAVGLDQDTLDRLKSCLAGEATLPPPDLGYLRQHRDEAVAALEHFVGNGSDEDTKALLDQVRELLS